ncbi:MAG: hypothetical protein C0508_23460 [Cyanobacteria bacterium PR.023]|nr:hypothetical protein [Cyanobacteria bacterium PR.023]
MTLLYEDYADPPMPNRAFNTASELAMFLEEKHKHSMMCKLIANNGFELQIGIDGDIGCAQFISTTGNPPYFIAITPTRVVEESHDFFMTGSATEIQGKHCLPFEVLKTIVLDFFNTGEKSTFVKWEEG